MPFNFEAENIQYLVGYTLPICYHCKEEILVKTWQILSSLKIIFQPSKIHVAILWSFVN